jgi:hypothetical protein
LSVLPVGFGSALGGYQIERSLRFNSADSAYLNRTPGSASNRKTWTWSGWVKRGKLGSRNIFFAAGGAGNNFGLEFSANNELDTYQYVAGYQWQLLSSSVYRDVSAWYHIVLALDTTQATSTNRVKLYVNGVQVTAFSTSTYPTQNTDYLVNSTSQHNISDTSGASLYMDGYLTEVNFIDGQALTPSSFGETDSNTGVWKPKKYDGTYGTNGFFLKFADNSGTTSTTLGKDSSGNGNNWTPNNFSVTAGAGNDSLVDSPTSYGTDTGVGGEVRGNYCTLNPLQNGGLTITNGNLTWAGAGSSVKCSTGSIAMTSGKWYFEALITGSSGGNWYSGVCNLSPTLTSAPSATATGWGLLTGGSGTVLYKSNNNVLTSLSSSSVTGSTVSFAVDVDAGKIWFAQNGTWLEGSPSAGTGASYTNLTGTQIPYVAGYDSNDQGSINFGQRAFAYTAPSGFKALCTQNLPTPTIGATSTTQANDYFNPVLYTGTGANQSITVGFQPDFSWLKTRSGGSNHVLIDSVRGVTKYINSNTTAAEATSTDQFLSFDSNGFTLGANVGAGGSTNQNGTTYVGWNWKANGAGSSNTAGSITSTVSANTTSGFSIVTYTGNATSGATVGHGLGVAPNLIIVRNRTASAQNWQVYSSVLGATKRLFLDLTDAENTFSGAWNNTAPTSTVFSLGNATDVNGNTNNFVAYCFAAVPGYSAFGSYTGNGSADGPFVYTGFRPKFVLHKCSSLAGDGWLLYDTVRQTYNVVGAYLQPNLSNAEGNTTVLDILSNGFKLRSTFSSTNSNGATYIYAAFAESPFQFANAR